MRVLVLGGTGWLGRVVAQAGVATGHDVTCLARGESGAMPDGVQVVLADRDREDALARLLNGHADHGTWDVVVDVARQPGQVRRAAAELAPVARHYAFVSSCSVYADQTITSADESGATLPALDDDVMSSMEVYGQAKVACEQHVLAAFGPDRCLFARAGLIAGPGDVTDRTGYWPLRFARPSTPDGQVLVPDAGQQPTQVIDVRDLARWLLAAGEAGAAGPFDIVGPVVSLADHLELARSVAGHGGPVVAAAADWLVAHSVDGWMGPRSLPLWLPDAEFAGLTARTGERARTAGLLTRPLPQTLADILAWELTRPADHVRRAGLTDADERDLLGELAGLTN
jgi:2'-hydroxyisoflavone reductase